MDGARSSAAPGAREQHAAKGCRKALDCMPALGTELNSETAWDEGVEGKHRRSSKNIVEILRNIEGLRISKEFEGNRRISKTTEAVRTNST